MNTYITAYDYLRGNSGHEIASLLGNIGRLSGAHALGASTLTLRMATNKDLLQDDQITIFDGSSSETVTVSTDTAYSTVSIPLTVATQFAHADGTVYCSNGVLGSLADDIVTASDMLEDQCLQSLLLTSRTDTLSLQTMQASISKDGVLTLKPQNFPVQTVTGVTLNSGLTSISFDATKASIELGQQLVKFYQLNVSGNPTGSPFITFGDQRTKGTITLTYTSGFAYASLPPRVKKACVLYVSELLSKRRNSTGAIRTMQGKRLAIYGIVGDTSGESILIKEAANLLSSFTREAF